MAMTVKDSSYFSRIGSVKSERKTQAARINAKRGGWPKGRPRGKTQLQPV